MISNKTDSELGRELMTVRGFQWIYGVKDDPYALLLRAESDDPHELGRRVRERGSLYWSSAESWVTADHATGAEALADGRLGVRPPAPQDVPSDRASYAWQIPSLDDVFPLDDACLKLARDEYERLRELVEPAFTGEAAPAQHAAAVKHHEQRLDALANTEAGFDLTADLIRPAVTAAVASLLGVPAERGADYERICSDAAVTLDATLCPPRLNTARSLVTAVTECRDLARQLAAAAGQDTKEDLVGRVARAAGRPAAEVLCTLFTTVGIEVAVTLAGNAVSAMLDDRDEWAKMTEDPARSADVVRETLRHAPPVRMQKLVAAEDLVLGGEQVRTGSQVVVLIEAADRDNGAFPDADRFVVGRETGASDLFGTDGLPVSVVAAFARTHAAAALETLARRLPNLRRTGPAVRRLRSPVSGGMLQFPVGA
ncbi:P450-derived glycosyltransferase activator [Streptomyces sp. Li-HN-5-11]|uniref:cytochrome P450 family protein n=1 Tax=Streptomyces sp. Li-HN-5-11 TaxID=3075432 RepID=UPI0028AB82A2|nr:P450-derived glycosyltransferase activator [Streptomyces sp. Li-HN-5-11]WNM31352.1 P450-derived glycosyltransferase activator [Streptomyces sp. Li-HN-5-11]